MIDSTLLVLFMPTFFVVSITPGMCMTLAMTLGMSIGLRKTLWMMWGELLGVAIVAIAAVLGVSAAMLQFPQVFSVLKLLGAGYLIYVGINMWRLKGKLVISQVGNNNIQIDRQQLFYQGLITAIANPKGWAFMVSLLPPFINPELALPVQLMVLISIILCSEFICMMIYATGGKTIGKLLTQQKNVKLLNKISGSLMMLVGLWLALG
ncbi:LysE family translocator [Colwelliaceae bacterium MEBiC 14330]